MRKERIFFDVLLSTFISALCIFIGTSGILDYLHKSQIIGSKVEIDIIKNAFNIIGIILSTYLLSFRLAKYKSKYESSTNEITRLIKFNKDTTFEYLFSKNYINHKNLNVRIFIPVKNIMYCCYYLSNRFKKTSKKNQYRF